MSNHCSMTYILNQPQLHNTFWNPYINYNQFKLWVTSHCATHRSLTLNTIRSCVSHLNPISVPFKKPLHPCRLNCRQVWEILGEHWDWSFLTVAQNMADILNSCWKPQPPMATTDFHWWDQSYPFKGNLCGEKYAGCYCYWHGCYGCLEAQMC